MANQPQIIGVDLGGTKIAAGKISQGKVEEDYSSLLSKQKLESDAEAVIAVVVNTITHLFDRKVKGIGVGVPSVVDRKKGIIYDVVNIPSWKEVYLKSILESKFGVPAFIDNDANCFALGERLYGKGRKYENFVGLTIGTGIGGGVINKGRLLEDTNCGSGEFGEILYKDKRYEDYCSGLFFQNKYDIKGQDLFKRAKNKDKTAIKIFEEFGFHLGNAIKTVMCAVDPEAIIIGGSIVASKEFYEKAMWDQIKTFTFSRSVKKLKIEFSKQTKHSPILGAAAVCMQNIT